MPFWRLCVQWLLPLRISIDTVLMMTLTTLIMMTMLMMLFLLFFFDDDDAAGVATDDDDNDDDANFVAPMPTVGHRPDGGNKIVYHGNRVMLPDDHLARYNPLYGPAECRPVPARRTCDTLKRDAARYEMLAATNEQQAEQCKAETGQGRSSALFKLPSAWFYFVDGMHTVSAADTHTRSRLLYAQ